MSTKRIEYGDFQTPAELATAVTSFLKTAGVNPEVIIEPTCGMGSFVSASIGCFPTARDIFAFDINPAYTAHLVRSLPHTRGQRLHVECCNFFQKNWAEFFRALAGTILVIGNPPWVTNSKLGVLGSENVPQKSNFQRLTGFAAKTGKANFDISEWMLIRLLEALNHKHACLAMLCKTSTARKTLRHAWRNQLDIGRSSVHLIDAKKYFDVSVDACLLIIHTADPEPTPMASVYRGLSFEDRMTTMGLVGKELVADMDEYLRYRDIDGIAYYTWRSGMKHDAAPIMEFTRRGNAFVNGLGEEADLEPTYLFPLLKSSDIANGRLSPQRYVLVTQRRTSDDTQEIEQVAPNTWQYLVCHSSELDKRGSIIYAKRPRFAIFGVGDYTFSPWKVGISGLYKNCRFEVIGKYQEKPILLDDTCYFIPCDTHDEARFVCELLNSDVCQHFLHSLVFFDAKRPITIDVLNRIDIRQLAKRLGKEKAARQYLRYAAAFEDRQPLLVYEAKGKYRATSATRRR